MCVFNDWSNNVVGQTFVFSEACELPVLARDETVGRADPEAALLVFVEKTNVVTFECGRVFLVEDSKVQTIQACQTLLRSDPEIAVACLDDRLNSILWEAVFSQPRLVTKLFQTAIGIEGRRAHAGEEQ